MVAAVIAGGQCLMPAYPMLTKQPLILKRPRSRLRKEVDWGLKGKFHCAMRPQPRGHYGRQSPSPMVPLKSRGRGAIWGNQKLRLLGAWLSHAWPIHA